MSVITASERFNMEIPRLRCPDKPKIKLVFPQPGGPWSSTPLLRKNVIEFDA